MSYLGALGKGWLECHASSGWRFALRVHGNRKPVAWFGHLWEARAYCEDKRIRLETQPNGMEYKNKEL